MISQQGVVKRPSGGNKYFGRDIISDQINKPVLALGL